MQFSEKTYVGKIVSVNTSSKNGIVKTPVDFIKLTQFGILNDSHAGKWHRQITLLSKETIDEFAEKMNYKVSEGEFAENITTCELDLAKVKLFDRFIIGDAILEVTQIGKKCHGHTCAIFKKIGECIMPKQGVFCRVIEYNNQQKIKKNDEIHLLSSLLKIGIVTVSDSVFDKTRSDITGPKIKKILQEFFSKENFNIEIYNEIVSDDPEMLKSKLINMDNDNFDIIITTGGTGISKRDNTPDVVSNIITKNISGINEFIRVKYGYDNPNVLLSRSISGITKNRTLVYTLPGSVNAIEEYLDIILPTLKHSLCLVNNITEH